MIMISRLLPSICQFVDTATQSLTQRSSTNCYERITDPVGSVSHFCLIRTMVNWCQPYLTFSITNRDSRDQSLQVPVVLVWGQSYFMRSVRKIAKKRETIRFVMSACRPICPSVCPHGTTRLTVDGFFKNEIWYLNIFRKYIEIR